MKRVLLAVALAGVLVSCAPVVSSPIGGGGERMCNYVRKAVADGSMPVWQALEWYPQCGPFEVPG